MPAQITAYRILIELDEELEPERRAFGEVVEDHNAAEALPRNVLFIPMGWERELPPSEKLLYDDFREIDFFLLVLWDRWPRGGEKQYELARRCLADASMPMRRVVPLFKAVPPRQLRDPGEELQRILKFKERIEHDERTRYDPYADAEEFRRRLRRYLSEWLVNHERKADEPEQAVKSAKRPGARRPQVDFDATPRRIGEDPFDDPHRLNEEGQVRLREGSLDQAEEVFRLALKLANQRGLVQETAAAYGSLGVIFRRQGSREEAETAFLEALHACEQCGWQPGAAAGYTNLGLLHFARRDFVGAQRMFETALEIEKRIGRREGVVDAYGNLAVALERQGHLVQAEEARKAGRNEKRALGRLLEYPLGDLFPLYREDD